MNTAAESWAFRISTLEDPSSDDCLEHSIQLSKIPTKIGANTGTLLFVSAFLGHVWARWPDQISELFSGCLDAVQGDQQRRNVYLLALGLCPHESALKILEDLKAVDNRDAGEILSAQRLCGTDLTVLEPEMGHQLDMLWGAFFGSSDPRFLRQICSIIPLLIDDKAGTAKRRVAMAAHWSLMSHMQRNHMAVLTAMEAVHADLPQLDHTLQVIAHAQRQAQG